MKIFKTGNLHFWARTTLSLTGAAMVFLSIYFIDEKLLMWSVALLGLGIGAVGYYTAQAAIFGIKPFSEKPDTSEKSKLESDAD